MATHLASSSLPVPSTSIHELDQALVRADVTGDEGETFHEGSPGTVPSVLGNGAAYPVEFGSQSLSDVGHPIPVFAAIDTLKISGDLLNLAHPSGAPKARYFIGCGFDPSAPDLLAAALLIHPMRPSSTPPTPKITSCDARFMVEGPIEPPMDLTGPVRSVRQVLPWDFVGRLITAYPF